MCKSCVCFVFHVNACRKGEARRKKGVLYKQASNQSLISKKKTERERERQKKEKERKKHKEREHYQQGGGLPMARVAFVKYACVCYSV